MSGVPDGQEQWRAATLATRAGESFGAPIRPTVDSIPVAPLHTDRPKEEGLPWLPQEPRALGAVHDARGLEALEDEQRGGANLVWIRDVGARISALAPHDFAAPRDFCVILEPRDDAHLVLTLASKSVRTICDPSVSEKNDPSFFDSLARVLSDGKCALGARAWGESEASLEIAISVSSFVSSLRALEERSVPLSIATLGTTFVATVGTDFFAGIAKLRALRRVIARVLGAAGIAQRPHLAARGEWRILSGLDCPTNILRSTLAASAGLIGGADSIAVFPHDALGKRSSLGTRLARNTPLVLTLESHLDEPQDPARGSYSIEHMTDALAREAWARLREIESWGGVVAARQRVLEHIAASRSERERAFGERRAVRVGASRFVVPCSIESSAIETESRDSIRFEQLRARGQNLPVCVVAMEGCPEARVDFAREVASLVASNVQVVRGAPAMNDRAPLVIVCGADADFGEPLLDIVRVLENGGAKAIAVAGKPGAHEADLRAAGVKGFVFVSADIVGVLEHLLERALSGQVHESHS
jgi:methylmalonyl-CoA mutase